MEKYHYIQFYQKEPVNRPGNHKKLLRKTLSSILSKIIPIANPLFENRFETIKTWLLEIEKESGLPNREIGLDQNGDCVIILPFKDNYGYWIDTDMHLKNFKSQFAATEITKLLFERKWADFKG